VSWRNQNNHKIISKAISGLNYIVFILLQKVRICTPVSWGGGQAWLPHRHSPRQPGPCEDQWTYLRLSTAPQVISDYSWLKLSIRSNPYQKNFNQNWKEWDDSGERTLTIATVWPEMNQLAYDWKMSNLMQNKRWKNELRPWYIFF